MFCKWSGNKLRCLVAVNLSTLLACPNLMRAAPVQTPTEVKLNIVILEGDGAVNDVRKRLARAMVVQVEDENHAPVAGAAVVFLLPASGPSGIWANGTRTLQVKTNNTGLAVARGMWPTDVSGKFQIQVEATYQGVSATTTVTQVNAVITGAAGGGGLSTGKLIAILAVAGGAAAGGIIAAKRRGGGASTSTSIPIALRPGEPIVIAPH